MGFWEEAKLTVQALGGPRRKGPPPLAREWDSLVREDGDAVFLWGGAWRRGRTRLGWTLFNVGVGNVRQFGQGREPGQGHPATAASPEKVERLLSPLSHAARVRLLQVMYDGRKSAGQLTEASGLRGGNLYYHLKELLYGGYVEETEGGYDLTHLGCRMLLTLSAIASEVVQDRGEEGLPIVDEPDTGPYPPER